MRHTATLIAAIVIAPLAWILIAFGQDRSAQAFANAQSNGGFHTGDFVRPLLFLAAAGILIGLIATLRVSPVGAVLTGVVYAGSYALLLVTPKRLVSLLPHHLSVAGRSADLTMPLRTGTTLLLGAAMLVAVTSAGRWRRWPAPTQAEAGSPASDPLGPLEPKTRVVGADGLPDTTSTDSFSGFGDSRVGGTGYGASGFADTGFDENRYGDLSRSTAGDSTGTRWGDSVRGGQDGERPGT
ncbi:MAG TPA: hypothetical protein VGJ07_01965 [Rugosimonospora sp.]|jgi:hypothetical protein